MKISFTLLLICLATFINAQVEKKQWISINSLEIRTAGERTIIPEKYKIYRLVNDNLKELLFSAPNELNATLKNSQTIIELPMPNGKIERFKVVDASIMAPELAAQFPNIKTFSVQGVDDPQANGKLDWNDFGFHGMIRNPSGDVFIDPYSRNNVMDYITYYAKDFKKDLNSVSPEVGLLEDVQKKSELDIQSENRAMICSGTKLRTYRLAVACTNQYAAAATGIATPSISEVLSAVVTTVNRVDGVYETDFAIRLILIANETKILFPTAGTDPFKGNNNTNTLIEESQSVIDGRIGSQNYDIGHTFSTGAGGLAGLGVVCTSTKAKGVTGVKKPVGDPYDIDYVAHEMGHQFGGSHTFAATTGSCSGNGSSNTSVEPGSGVTIMAYAGICKVDNNLADHSIPYFHTISFDQIMAYTTTGSGSGCAQQLITTNHPPAVNIINTSYTIPKSTPFVLTGSATDQDGDSLTYSWEEIDKGSGNWNSGSKPYFRSYNPTKFPSRTFPLLSMILAGNTTYKTTIGEYLPSTAQTLNFRLTARDNKMGGGGVCYASTKVVIASAGPFEVTYPNAAGISWASTSKQTITWSVNGTNNTPISCATVNILISLDSGITFIPLLLNTSNDGSEEITVPTVPTTLKTCRIRIESVNNIFFDINDKDFTILATTVGIKEFSSSNSMDVQFIPNPFNERVQIICYGLDKSEKSQLVIYDMLGKIVFNTTILNAQIDNIYTLSTLNKGIYIVEIKNSKQKSISRLIKQ